jgi:iron complex transport system permease protein
MNKRTLLFFLLLLIILIASFVGHLFAGQVKITFDDYWNGLFQLDETNTNHLIVREFRIPRAIIALIAGAGLSIAGMFMQTLFNNPLAGPYVLGINTGSSLFVACSMMTGLSFLQSDLGIITSALLGALFFGFIILFFSFFTRHHVTLLLVGLMLGSFTGAIISVLQAMSSAQELKAFTIWTMGSLQQVQLDQLPIVALLFTVGCIGSLFLIKPMNALVLGEKSTELLGINIQLVRVFTIVITAVLTGVVTAFCGPIAFVGLAVPNLTKTIFRTQNHLILLLGNFIIGALFLLLSDSIIQLLEDTIQLPINAFTSLVGAPFIIYIVLKRMK